MTDIDALAQKIAANIHPNALWDLAAVADYLHRSENYTRQYIAALPDFPRPIRLPAASNAGATKARPLWRSKDVIAWAERYVEA